MWVRDKEEREREREKWREREKGCRQLWGKKVERNEGGGAYELVVECCAWGERVKSKK